MPPIRALTFATIAALALLHTVSPQASSQRVPAPVHGISSEAQADAELRVIVSLAGRQVQSPARTGRDTAIAESAARIGASLPAGARVLRAFRTVPAVVVSLPGSAVQALARHPDVASIALDAPVFAQLDQSAAMINADDVHTSLGVTGEGVTVAVLDTGIDTDHPALLDNLAGEACMLIGGGCPLSAGATDPCPVDPATTSSDYAEDGNGHGTHVAGIITSDGHDGGADRGIAPGADIKAFKVLNDCGQGDMANIIAAYDEILASHADVDVINMSLGDGTTNAPGTCEGRIPAMTTAVELAKLSGMVSFASSGNTGAKAGIGYPACINSIVSVGAVYDAAYPVLSFPACTDTNTVPDRVTCFSQSDAGLDLLAPGAVVESTFAGGGFLNLAGTSMSSPAAAAVAALLLDADSALTPAQIETRMKVTGVPITDAANGVTTCRIDALKAVQNVGPLCLAPPTDSDGDGCSDAEELTSEPALGGARDPLDGWDFFDVTGDQSVDLADTLDVLGFFGDPALPATPGDLRDRMVPDGAQPWQAAEAAGGVDLGDALVNLQSFGHDCSGPP